MNQIDNINKTTKEPDIKLILSINKRFIIETYMYILKIFIYIFLLILSHFLFFVTANALERPTPEEIEQYKKDGTLDERISFAKELGNDKTDSFLVKNFQSKTQGLLKGNLQSSLPAFNHCMPANGNVKVPVIVIDFSDAPYSLGLTNEEINNVLFNPADTKSITSFYKISSYNQLNISGDVMGVYRAQYPLSYYKGMANQIQARETLIKEAISYFDAQGCDFSQYDSNSDQYLDSFYILWSGTPGGWSNTWSTYKADWDDTGFTPDGLHLNNYVMYSISSYPTLYTSVLKHETGHLLGLPDYYSYDFYHTSDAPGGGLGDFDIMDSNQGGHNVFSKMLLGWITPQVISSGNATLSIKDVSGNAEGVLIMPGWNSNIYSEYFLIEYLTEDFSPIIKTPGLRIFHIDAATNDAGTNFKYNNSWTSHKLIRLMEADGLEHIEKGKSFNVGDLYYTDSEFNPDTFPNSDGYGGAFTGLKIDNIATGDETAALDISFVQSQIKPAIIRTYPKNGQSGVDKGVQLQIIFDHTVYEDTGFGNILLRDSNHNTITTVSKIKNNVLTIVPADKLRDMADYTLSVPSNAVRNAIGTNLDEGLSLSFTTASGAKDEWGGSKQIPDLTNIDIRAAAKAANGDALAAFCGKNGSNQDTTGVVRLNSIGEITNYKVFENDAALDLFNARRIKTFNNGDFIVATNNRILRYNSSIEKLLTLTMKSENAAIFPQADGNLCVFDLGGTNNDETVYIQYSPDGGILEQKTVSNHKMIAVSATASGYVFAGYAGSSNNINEMEFIKLDTNINSVASFTKTIPDKSRTLGIKFLFPDNQTDDYIRLFRLWDNSNLSIIKLAWDSSIINETQIASKAYEIYNNTLNSKVDPDGTLYLAYPIKFNAQTGRQISVNKISSDNTVEWQKDLSSGQYNIDSKGLIDIGTSISLVADTYSPGAAFYKITLTGPLNTYYVTFDYQDGSHVSSLTAYENETITEPNVPTRTGYIFGGWYKEHECVNKWIFSDDKVTGDIKLYAKWTEIPTYTVLIDTNNSAFGSASGGGSYKQGTNVTIKAIPKSGCRFINWSEGSNVVSTDASYQFKVTRDIQLIAVFESTIIPSYKISASPNNSAFGSVSGYGTYKSGLVASLNAVPKSGCAFKYWLEDDKVVSNDPTYEITVTADRTLVAEFEQIGKPEITSVTSIGYDSLKINWGPVNSASGYTIYRSTSSYGPYTKINDNATETTYIDSGLITGKKYYYKIKAFYNTASTTTYGDLSNFMLSMPIPSAPTNVSALSNARRSIKVTWDPVPGATKYIIYRSNSKNAKYKKLTETKTLSFTNKKLNPNKTYYYKIMVYHLEGKTKIYSFFSEIVYTRAMK